MHEHLKRRTFAIISHPHIEIPRRVKEHLGLDDERSWIVLDEFNVFTWPGFDLRPIKDRGGRVDYGFLPPKLSRASSRESSDSKEPAKLNTRRATTSAANVWTRQLSRWLARKDLVTYLLAPAQSGYRSLTRSTEGLAFVADRRSEPNDNNKKTRVSQPARRDTSGIVRR